LVALLDNLAFGGVLSWFRKDIGWQFIPASTKELSGFVQRFGYGYGRLT
jgi:hypothetical protein